MSHEYIVYLSDPDILCGIPVYLNKFSDYLLSKSYINDLINIRFMINSICNKTLNRLYLKLTPDEIDTWEYINNNSLDIFIDFNEFNKTHKDLIHFRSLFTKIYNNYLEDFQQFILEYSGKFCTYVISNQKTPIMYNSYKDAFCKLVGYDWHYCSCHGCCDSNKYRKGFDKDHCCYCTCDLCVCNERKICNMYSTEPEYCKSNDCECETCVNYDNN
jgi:hypothetical protein